MTSSTNTSADSSSVLSIIDMKEFDALLNTVDVVVVHFWAEWAPQCIDMNEVMEELARKYVVTSDSQPQQQQVIKFVKVEAEECPELSEREDISAVPTFAFYRNFGKRDVEATIDGAKAAELTEKVHEFVKIATENALKSNLTEEEKTANLNKRLHSLINKAPCVVFMKGVPETPRCKFSRALMDLMHENEIIFSSFDILGDDNVRQGLKIYSDWPTYPQIYINGELVGGLDIVKEMIESKDIFNILPKECFKPSLNDRLKGLINKANVVLFMKGAPNEPKCGFSRNTVQLLQEVFKTIGKDINDKSFFDTFDILSDNEIRQGLKEFSDWPTFPQLYVKGDLIGGLDILKEMFESNELHDLLKEI